MTNTSGWLAGFAAAGRDTADDPTGTIEEALAAYERYQAAVRMADEDVPPG